MACRLLRSSTPLPFPRFPSMPQVLADKLLPSQGYSHLWLLCTPFPWPLEVLSPYMYLTWLTSLIWRVPCSLTGLLKCYFKIHACGHVHMIPALVLSHVHSSNLSCLLCIPPQFQSTQFRSLLKPFPLPPLMFYFFIVVVP